MKTLYRCGATASPPMVLAAGATAHTGHGTDGLQAGLMHPFALHHLLAMVAVGAWPAAALLQGRVHGAELPAAAHL